MDDWLEPKARAAAAGIAMLVGGALCTQILLDVIEKDRDVFTAFFKLFGYFTIWSNGIVAIAAGWCGLVGRARGAGHPAVLAASAVFILVVGIVYNTLLAGLNHPPTLLRQLIDHVFHIASPLLWVLWWLLLRPPHRLSWAHGWAVLPVPLLYCAWSMWRGAVEGRYAYFFIDVSTLGWNQVIVNIIGFAALFAVLMLAAIGWDRRSITQTAFRGQTHSKG
jgi:hypothetical protein